MKKFIILAVIIGVLGFVAGSFVGYVDNYTMEDDEILSLYCASDNNELVEYVGNKTDEDGDWYMYAMDDDDGCHLYGLVRQSYASYMAQNKYDDMSFIEKLSFINNK